MQTFRRRIALAFAFVACVCIGLPASGGASSEFYAGKTITIVVSTPAGGGFDIYTRILQPYLTKYLPGHPTVIVRNMPGAGGIVATNYLFNVAPKDGTVIGLVHGAVPFAPLMQLKGTQYDARAFNWLASLDRLPLLCISWYTSPVKTFDDLRRHQLIVGSTGPGSGMTALPMLLNRMFGTRFKVVSGYKGGNAIYLAMERGEVQGRCVLTYPTLHKIYPDWLTEKKVNIVAVLALEHDSEPALAHSTFVYDLAKTKEQRSILDFALASGEIDRPILAPPGVPASRVAALRDAIRRAAHDPGLLKEFAQKDLTLHYRTGEGVASIIEKVYAMPAQIIKKAVEMINP